MEHGAAQFGGFGTSKSNSFSQTRALFSYNFITLPFCVAQTRVQLFALSALPLQTWKLSLFSHKKNLKLIKTQNNVFFRFKKQYNKLEYKQTVTDPWLEFFFILTVTLYFKRRWKKFLQGFFYVKLFFFTTTFLSRIFTIFFHFFFTQILLNILRFEELKLTFKITFSSSLKW